MATKKISLKLLIDEKARKVLFAEGGKDFVDFLFSLLTLPVGSVVRLLSEKSMVGCIGKLHKSVDNLNSTYMQQNVDKNRLLQPKISSTSSPTMLLLEAATDSPSPQNYYVCPNKRHVTNVSGATCPCGLNAMSEINFVSPNVPKDSAKGEGYVKGVVTYMITDNLEVTPMSTISSIAVLNSFNIKEVGSLEEKVVDLGFDEGLSVLRASLQSSSVLTDIFLRNQV